MTRDFALALLSTMLVAGAPASAEDFGARVEAMLAAESQGFFGINGPLAASAAPSARKGYRTAGAGPGDALLLAPGLTAEFVTRETAEHFDMMAFWPADAPTHLIGCVEGKREEIAPGKLNPGVQRITLADGKVETIVRGTSGCDGIRTTPWGTILFTEEEDLGGAYELLDPLAITEPVVITDRASGATSDAAMVVRRMALPTMAWEGLAVLPSGVVYGGDEERPGTVAPDADGGALFKFVPARVHPGGKIGALDDSPLAEGRAYAMQVSCLGDRLQYGQGCETGNAAWIEVEPARARPAAAAAGATGYYRPEDLQQDPAYAGEGVRFCFTNTGNEPAMNYAEVMCVVDADPLYIQPAPDADGKTELKTEISRFVEGDADFNSFDNLDFQPGAGILYVIEDHSNGDVFACLPDGADRNLKSDGCIRVLSVKDSSAEPTGFVFAPDGLTAYVSIQHSEDSAMSAVDDYGTDDLIRISGFASVTK